MTSMFGSFFKSSCRPSINQGDVVFNDDHLNHKVGFLIVMVVPVQNLNRYQRYRPFLLLHELMLHKPIQGLFRRIRQQPLPLSSTIKSMDSLVPTMIHCLCSYSMLHHYSM
jgi:hypothetical protein